MWGGSRLRDEEGVGDRELGCRWRVAITVAGGGGGRFDLMDRAPEEEGPWLTW